MPSRYESERYERRGSYGARSGRGEECGEEDYGGSGRGRMRHPDEEREHRMRGQEMRSERAARAPHTSEGYSEDIGQGGWFGNPMGHSMASERGWENSEHGRSGWFGDPEGHSRASRKGWGESPEEGSSSRAEAGGRWGRSHYEEEEQEYPRSRRYSSRGEDNEEGYGSSRGGRPRHERPEEEYDERRGRGVRRGWGEEDE